MKKFLVDCLTGIDNKTFDFMRVFAAIAFLVYFANSFLAINEPWNPIQFAEGFGILVVSVSASLRIKNDTEPQP